MYDAHDSVWYDYLRTDTYIFLIAFITCRTAKDNPPVTYAIAACETQNVNVSVLPCFGLNEGSCITAKDMWGKMVQVKISTYVDPSHVASIFMCLILHIWPVAWIQFIHF